MLEPLGDGQYVCVDARIFPSVMGCPEVEENVGYDSEVDDCIFHPLECCSQRGTVGIVYTTPSVTGKWIWRSQVQDFVTHAPQSHDT